MLTDEVMENVTDFHRFLRQEGFDTEYVILIGSAALVMYGLENQAADIDVLIPHKKKFTRLQSLFNFEKCPISYDRNGIKYQIGLPHDFNLVRPYNAKEIVTVGDVNINVRPLHLIARDYEVYLKEKEAAAMRIGEPLSVLNEFPPYAKYKERLEKLRKKLWNEDNG